MILDGHTGVRHVPPADTPHNSEIVAEHFSTYNTAHLRRSADSDHESYLL